MKNPDKKPEENLPPVETTIEFHFDEELPQEDIVRFLKKVLGEEITNLLTD